MPCWRSSHAAKTPPCSADASAPPTPLPRSDDTPSPPMLQWRARLTPLSRSNDAAPAQRWILSHAALTPLLPLSCHDDASAGFQVGESRAGRARWAAGVAGRAGPGGGGGGWQWQAGWGQVAGRVGVGWLAWWGRGGGLLGRLMGWYGQVAVNVYTAQKEVKLHTLLSHI